MSSLARLAPLAILAVVALCWWPVLELGLYGWDTYPMIASGRFATVTELWGNLTEELMEGKFPGGRYWRPLVHLSFGFDHAFWGLEATGYRVTDLCILAAGALAVHSLFQRLLDSEAGAFIAGIVYAAHPLHWELLPLPARRADALCVLFTVLALRSMAAPAPPLTPKQEQRALPPWPHMGRWCAPWVALWCGLAMASKETGILAAPLCFALGWMAHTFRSSWLVVFPAFCVSLVYVGLHTWVLGELGGGPRASLEGALTNTPAFAERYGILLVYPVPFLDAVPSARVLYGLLAPLGLAVVWLWLGQKRAERGGERPLGSGRGVALALIWLTLVLLMTSASGVKRSWYSVAFLPAWCILLGSFVALIGRLVEKDRKRVHWLALLAGVLAIVLGGHVARDIAPEKQASAEAARLLLERFEAAVLAGPDGTVQRVDARPPEDAAVRHGKATERPMTLPPYGLEAYAVLRFPNRIVRCDLDLPSEPPPPAPHSEELLVLLRANTD